ncbi:MAG TPA: cation:proton antiporter [Gemmatimonadales bacterium]|nr:cation:proton antiporter [Gemmatimonadales bacterium]
MRRAVILLVVFALVDLVRPLGSSGYGAQALLAFGFLVLAAYTVGEIAKSIHAPAIVGYMAAGVIFGPVGLEALSHETVVRLQPVSALAVALIAFLAGAELRWEEVRERWAALLKVTGTELALSALALGLTLFLAGPYIPFLRDATTVELVAVAVLVASIAIVHSPAVTMALLTETRAHGPVARTTLGVVLISDVVVVMLFSGALALVRSLVPVSGAAGPGVLAIVWEISGALIVGGVLGAGIALYLRFVAEELFLFALLVAFLGAEVARLTHVETLLTLLTAGFIAENFSPPARGQALRHAMERSAAPVFVVFFALSGAEIDVMTVVRLLPLLVPLALVRVGAIWAGTRLGGRWAHLPQEERRWLWMGLVSQAGVAIGLAAIVAEVFPGFGEGLRSMLLALIALNESVGAVLFRRALVASGEYVPGAAATPEPDDSRLSAPGSS